MEANKKLKRLFAADDLYGTEWLGEVVDVNDPKKQGRCRVKVFGKMDNLSIDEIPWAFPAGSSIFSGGKQGAGSLSIPKVGAKVKIRFSGGNLYAPEYFAVQDVNESLIKEISGSYENSHVFFFDEDEKIKCVYTKSEGLKIFHKDSHITINPDSSITIEHKDTKSIVELVGPNINIIANSRVNITANSKVSIEATETHTNGSSTTKLGPTPVMSAVAAEPLWAFLNMLAAAVDAKLPSSPGVLTSQAASFQQMSTSKNVKISI
jgi:hypothetical protein